MIAARFFALLALLPSLAFGVVLSTPPASLPPLIGQPPIYVGSAQWGAACNGLRLGDVTTTAASPVITSASYTFTQADVGKLISVWAGTGTSITTASTTSGSNIVTFTGTKPTWTNGSMVYGTNLTQAAGNYVTGIINTTSLTSTSFTTNLPASATGSGITVTAYPVINTTIQSVSGGAATLAVNMASSLTGNARADFGTNDATALQTAANAANVLGGGLLVLPRGMCVSNASIILYNNTSVQGQGPGVSILKWLSTSDMVNAILVGINTYNQTIGSSCNYNTYGAAQRNNHFQDFEVDDLSATDATYAVEAKGIDVSCSINSLTKNVYIHDSPATCLANDQGMPTYAINNTLQNCGRLAGNGIGGNGVGDGSVGLFEEAYSLHDNVVINPAHFGLYVENVLSATTTFPVAYTVSGNIVFQGGNSQVTSADPQTAGIGNSGVYGMVATGNFIYGIQSPTTPTTTTSQNWDGIAVDGGTLNYAGGVQNVIVGNYVRNTFNCVMLYTKTASSSSADTLIDANNCANMSGGGIEAVSSSDSGEMNNIRITNNLVTGAASACILILGTNTYNNLNISNNTGVDCGQNSGENADVRLAGLSIGANVAGFTMNGNSFYDDGANTQKYGFAIASGVAISGASVKTNNFANNHTQPLDILGTITGVFEGNTGMPAPTISGCSATAAAGNGDIGKYTSGTTGTCAVTVTPFGTANIIANNGWVANGYDSTTAADIQTQTADTTTTFTLSGTTVSGDVIKFQGRMW